MTPNRSEESKILKTADKTTHKNKYESLAHIILNHKIQSDQQLTHQNSYKR